MLLHIISDSMVYVEYNDSQIFINSKQIATYGISFVRNTANKEYIGEIYLQGGTIYAKTLFGSTKTYYINKKERIIINHCTKKAVAVYNDDTPYGAISSYIAYTYFCFLRQNKKSVAKTKVNVNEPLRENVKKENQVIEPPYVYKNNYKKDEYKLPEKKKEEYKVPEKKQNNINIPSFSGSGGVSIILILILGLAIYATIQCIPDSWKDLKTYIPKGDTGIIICFFTALTAGIVSLLYSIISKRPKFEECVTYFGSICVCGIFLSSILTLISYSNGNTKFVGFFLFDIFLCILAPIIGCLQFAIPIGIVAFIISGIICLAKK